MSLYWNTKSYGGKNYIILKHPVGDVTTKVYGVKFHCGYGVVEKGSKAHKALRTIPILRGAKELPLTMLKSLHFITRSQDIALIYGKDIYVSYQRALLEHAKQQEAQKFEELQAERNSGNSTKCKHLLLNNEYCSNERVQGSTGFCRVHIMDDIGLIRDLGVDIPSYVGKPGFGKETTEFFAKICRKIERCGREKGKKELQEVLETDTTPVAVAVTKTEDKTAEAAPAMVASAPTQE
jgi:hypothetical protein